MTFLQRSGVYDPIMHFIDNQTLHNPVLGPNNHLSCIETIPDSVMWPLSSVLLWHILTALYCMSLNLYGLSSMMYSLVHMFFGGEDEAAVYSNITSPQYFMLTPDSPNSVRPGGLAQQIIKETYFDVYEDPCIHGFFNRGNLTDPAVAQCVDTAMQHLQTFFMENL